MNTAFQKICRTGIKKFTLVIMISRITENLGKMRYGKYISEELGKGEKKRKFNTLA